MVRHEKRLRGPAVARGAAHPAASCVMASDRPGTGWEALNYCFP